METGRIRKRQKGFAQVSNAVLRDMELSLKAKGLYSLIESYLTIPDWDLYKSFLMRQCKEKDTAFNGAWKELKNRGYLIQYKSQDKKTGKWIYEYELTDEPCINETLQDNNAPNPDTQKPHMENPHMENPHMENQPVNNNTNLNKTNLNNTDLNKKNSKDKNNIYNNNNNNNNIESEENNLSCSTLSDAYDRIIKNSNYQEEELDQVATKPETNQKQVATKQETKQEIKTIVPEDDKDMDRYIKSLLKKDKAFDGLDFTDGDAYNCLMESIVRTQLQDNVEVLGIDQWGYFKNTLRNKLTAMGIIKNR